MAAFSKLYPVLRVLLGDTGVIALYQNTQLDNAIRAGLAEDATMMTSRVYGGPPMGLPQTWYQEDPNSAGSILPDFFSAGQQGIVDQYRITIRAALGMLRPSMGVKATRNPVLHVQRNQAEVIAELKQMLAQCTNETVVVSGTADIDNWLYGFLNFLAKMQGKI